MLHFFIYNVFYTLLCICISVTDFLRFSWTNCIKYLTLKKLFDHYQPSANQRLRKLPVHLGVVIVEDELSLRDVARIAAWSLVVGISCVTVYDHKGRCKLRENELRSDVARETLKLKKSSPKKIYPNFLTSNNTTDSTKNGFHKEIPQLENNLHIIGPEDGQQKIVDVTRRMCQLVKGNQLAYSDISIPYADSFIQKEMGFPDPDLVFRFGKTQSMLGYLPWQLRLTEIFSLPTHRNLTFSEFFEQLDSFADIKQRCGV